MAARAPIAPDRRLHAHFVCSQIVATDRIGQVVSAVVKRQQSVTIVFCDFSPNDVPCHSGVPLHPPTGDHRIGRSLQEHAAPPKQPLLRQAVMRRSWTQTQHRASASYMSQW